MNKYWDKPQTIRQAVDYICDMMDEEGIEYIQNNSSASIHHTAGRFIRNDFGLWDKEAPIVQDAIKNYGIAHADDISGLIYSWVWAIYRKEEFDPVKEYEIFHKHWKMFGMTSLEAGGIK